MKEKNHAPAALRRFTFVRNGHTPTASTGRPFTGPMPISRATGGPVFRTNALASSVSGSLCQGPGLGLALLLTSNLNAMPGGSAISRRA